VVFITGTDNDEGSVGAAFVLRQHNIVTSKSVTTLKPSLLGAFPALMTLKHSRNVANSVLRFCCVLSY
jgi:hypothetical protein